LGYIRERAISIRFCGGSRVSPEQSFRRCVIRRRTYIMGRDRCTAASVPALPAGETPPGI
jgi:hypothetical protein